MLSVLRYIQQINKANRGKLTPEELKERQGKAMQDPEIQNILTDPVMRQVSSSSDVCLLLFLEPELGLANGVITLMCLVSAGVD